MFMKDNFDVDVQYAGHYFWPNKITSKLKSFILYGLYYRNGDINKNHYAKKIIKDKLLLQGVSLVVFDWQKYYEIFMSKSILEVSKDLGISRITVPHGITLMDNLNMMSGNKTSSITPTWDKQREIFDVTVVQNLKSKELHVQNGVQEEKIMVLGSARYCNEWRNIYSKLVPESNNKRLYLGNNTLKIVFMDHLSSYRINGDIVYSAIKKIINYGQFELIIKPTTGANEKKSEGISNISLKNIASLDYDSHSNELIKWADVVIATTSSIVIEVLLEKKIFIYPKYFHKNTMRWEQYGACLCVNSDEELMGVLSSIKEERNINCYSDSSVDNFICDVVYGNKLGRDVLNDYVKLINECLS